MKFHAIRIAAFAAIVLFAGLTNAEVKLPTILADHMVLQRDMPIRIWGWAAPAEQVSVTLNGASKSATADASGSWSVDLTQMKAGGPYELHVKGRNSITLKDILIGDVWLAGGQSNMEQTIDGWEKKATDEHAAKTADRPDIRFFVADQHAATTPQNNLGAGVAWTRCTPETVGDLSAVAYFFAQNLTADEHVAVGIADIAWGGTEAEAWISPAQYALDPELKAMADATQASRSKHPPMEENGKKQRKSAYDGRHDTSGNYNGMVNPLTPLRIKGVIWYQGGNNTSNGEIKIYRRALPAVFKAWRTAWGEGNFPIIMGQQSLFSGNEGKVGNYPILRNDQLLTSEEQPAIGMVTTIDLNKNPHDVHDIDKPSMGLRMANAARAVAYHENIEYSGPLFDHADVKGAKMQVFFTHDKSGLAVKNGGLAGFEIAGADKAYVPAEAAIDGDTVVVSSPKVTDPVYVRYAWSAAPVATLYNNDNLPASPFTSEPQ